jgi:hypothetical protein
MQGEGLKISRIKYANKAFVGIRLFDSRHVAYMVWHAAYLRIPFRRTFPRYLALKFSLLKTSIRSSHLPRVLHALPVLYSWTSWSWKWGHYTRAKRLYRVTSKQTLSSKLHSSKSRKTDTQVSWEWVHVARWDNSRTWLELMYFSDSSILM